MRRERVGASLTACAFLLASGCTLLVGLDGLSGGSSASDGGDGSANTDAASQDARAPAEGSVPVTDAGGADARFCARQVAFLCDDFDDVDASVSGAWDPQDTNGASSLSTVDTRSVSAPHSLHLQSTSSTTTVTVGKKLIGVQAATLTFDLYIEARGSNLSAAWFQLSDAAATAVYIQAPSDSYAQLTEHYVKSGTEVYESSPGPAIPQGAWSHVVLDVDLTRTLAILTVNGAELARRTLAPVWNGASSVTVFVGVPATPNASLYYDNVTIQTR